MKRQYKWSFHPINRKRQEPEIKAPLYSNRHCPICGSLIMNGVVCRMYEGTICMGHCLACEHFRRMFWHCMFSTQEKDSFHERSCHQEINPIKQKQQC